MGRAVVLLSGGLDSATAAAVAMDRGFALDALTIAYGQRHEVELAAAERVAKALGVGRHVVQRIDLRAFGGSALTDEIEVPKWPGGAGATGPNDSGPKEPVSNVPASDVPAANEPASDETDSGEAQRVPVTYVPARNTVFLALALAFAESSGAFDIFIGANAVDYSGYPDCRPEFIEQFERLANVATAAAIDGTRRFRVHAPLIEWTKARIIREGARLGVDFGLTHSCYDPDESGAACGLCESCRIRAKGFRDAGVPDPTRYVGRQNP